MKSQEIDEQKKAGANYVFSFYNEVILLTHNFSNYETLNTEIKYRYGRNGNDFTEKATQEEKDVIKTTCANIRYLVSKTYIGYYSIMSNIKNQSVNEEIVKLKNKIKEDYIVKEKDLEEYVILLNSVLVSKIIKSLLESSQDLLNELYADENNANGNGQ